MTKYQIITLLLGSVFVFGAIVGSFLNVCIYRIPEGLSIVSPRSRCPKCEKPIVWYQNIPIASWILLRGKCAQCATLISIRYPLVETLNGLLYVLVFYYFFLSWATPVYFVFLSMLVVITFVDLDHQIIPNSISLPGIVCGFIASFVVPWIQWHESLLGAVAGGGLLFVIAAGYRLVAKKEGMGMGDVKLLAMIGAFLGWQSILPVVFVASLAGSIVGIPLMLMQKADRKLALPFGPFLSFAAMIYLFWWDLLFSWYQSLFY
ncbi:MAG: prepilin peptidase [Desulfuromonas sp.]|nr:MAG: prepilin peptidase [Desulfuromonas sp.]